MKKLYWMVAALACLLPVALAQNPGAGGYPYGSFDSKGFDTVNLGNSNVSFTIPIVSRAGRGGSFQYAIQFNSLVWTPIPSGDGSYSTWSYDPAWGFRGGLSSSIGSAGYLTWTSTPRACRQGLVTTYVTDRSNFVYHAPSGTNYGFAVTIPASCPTAINPDAFVSSSSDPRYQLISSGTRIRFTESGGKPVIITPAYTSDGTDPIDATDSNGNQIASSGSNSIVDTLGVAAMTIATSGLTTTYTYPVALQADASTTASATMIRKSYLIRETFQAPNTVDIAAFSDNLVDSIHLADGSTYSFAYETTPGYSDGSITGRIASVTLPNGGVIQYSYPGCYSNGGMTPDGTPCEMDRTTSDGTKIYAHYTHVGNPQYRNFTIDEKNNRTEFNFVTATDGKAYEYNRIVHQGNSTDPTGLEERDTYYNSDWNRSTGPSTISAIDVAEAQGGRRLTHTTLNVDSAGKPLSFLEYDWTDALKRQTTYTYNGSGFLSDIFVGDDQNRMVTHTSYGYDEYTLASTSNVPNHIAVNSARGNQTSTHQWLGATDCNNATDFVHCVTTTSTYYDTGALHTSALNATPATTYLYDATQTFVTNTTLPFASSGVQLGTGASYDATSTALTSATGYNAGQTVTVANYDRLMRPTQVTMPDTGTSSLGYSPGESTVQRLMSSGSSGSQYAWQSTQYDGYGRVKRTAVHNGFGGYYITDTCYGADGRARYVTIPYTTNTAYGAYDCTQSHETYTYDALGRTTNVTHADGTQRNFSYLIYNGAFSTLSTDELGKTRIVDTDALGRQTIVCEVTSTPLPQSGTLGPCNTAIGADGYKTIFSYDMANRQTFVGQELQGRNSVVDAVGRTIYTYEPERGETTYSYEYQSNGELLVTRTRASANHTECTVRAVDNFCDPNFKTKTITRYDTLGRMTIVEYKDAATNATVQPRRLYYHDVTGPGATFTAENALGLLTQAAIDSGDSNYSISRYTYDLMGRPTHTSDCATGWCGQGQNGDARAFHRWYSYDYLGNKGTERWNYGWQGASGPQVTLTSTWSVAGELLGLGGGLGGVSYSAGARGAQGNLDEQYGNGVQGTFAYDAMNRQVGRWACLYTTHAGCAAGTHLEGSYAVFTGNKVTRLINEQGDNTLGYDDLGRLAYRGPTAGGSGPTLSWSYDRFGNRLSQTGGGTGGSAPQVSLNISPNSNKDTDYTYDLAGNLLNDGLQSYLYDQEGNLLCVDGCATSADNYDALNRRIMHRVGDPNIVNNYQRFEYGIDGRLAGVWRGEDTYQWLNRYYGPRGDSFAYWTNAGDQVHYQHTDYLGTVKARTDANHNTEAYYVDLPFGERAPDLIASTDDNTEHYATLDRDSESDTHHAQFRTYEPRIGRWLQPDPYDGSYDFADPQSWNRYSYVLNNPLGFVDPTGQDYMVCTAYQYSTKSQKSLLGGGDFHPNDSGIYQECYTIFTGSPAGGVSGPRGGAAGASSGGGNIPGVSRPYAPNNVNKPIDWKKVGSCLVDSTLNHYGLTGLTAASGALAIPISKSLVPPFRMIGEPTTNLLSVLGHYVEINVPRITIDGLASTNLLRIAGRANPYVAGALLAIDVGMISYDTYQCYQKQ